MELYKFCNYSGRFLNYKEVVGRKGFPLVTEVIESRMFRPCFLVKVRFHEGAGNGQRNFY